MLSASQVEQYREEGYVVPDFRLPDKMVDAIRVHHELFLENHPEFVDYRPALLIHDTGGSRQAHVAQLKLLLLFLHNCY